MIVDAGLAEAEALRSQPYGRGRVAFGCTFAVISARAEEAFGGPTFRKGLWRFVRTLEIVKPQNVRQKLLEREMTRCVDPTHAMKATFSTALDRKLSLFEAGKSQ